VVVTFSPSGHLSLHQAQQLHSLAEALGDDTRVVAENVPTPIRAKEIVDLSLIEGVQPKDITLIVPAVDIHLIESVLPRGVSLIPEAFASMEYSKTLKIQENLFGRLRLYEAPPTKVVLPSTKVQTTPAQTQKPQGPRVAQAVPKPLLILTFLIIKEFPLSYF